VKRGSFAGKVAIVNAQSRLSAADCQAVAATFTAATRCNFVVAKDGKDAAVVLTVIDDPKEPTMLLAPEEHWGKVNVAKVVDDLATQSAKDKVFASRSRKLVAKALSLLCGSGASQYPGNLMNAATLHDLDFVEEQVPVDVAGRCVKYLGNFGVTKKEWVTYRHACMEGWAPAPTNECQQAIWDKVHAMPKNPMKIEFDPKKGR